MTSVATSPPPALPLPLPPSASNGQQQLPAIPASSAAGPSHIQTSIDLTADESDGEGVAVAAPGEPNGTFVQTRPATSTSPSASAAFAKRSPHIPMFPDPSMSMSPSSSRVQPPPSHSPFVHPGQPPQQDEPNGIVFRGANIKMPVNHGLEASGNVTAGPSSGGAPGGFRQYAQGPSVMGWSPSPSAPHFPSHLGMNTGVGGAGSSGQVMNGHGHGVYMPQQQQKTRAGTDPSSAIDLTSRNIPSPPRPGDEKKPLCIGSIRSAALMIYPCPAVVIGAQPPPGSREKYDVVGFRGAEMLKVKLKYRAAGTLARKDEPNSMLPRDVIQVLTPSLTTYIGDLEPRVAVHLGTLMARGLARLEGFVQRLQPSADHFQIRVDVLVFTLPSNVHYIANYLANLNLYLFDPVPPYDPSRHSDRPRYDNPHGGSANAQLLHDQAQRRLMGQGNSGVNGEFMFSDRERDKATQVEVQRKQVDEVFKTLENGKELDQSDPGPLIKTDLFPHQRKALTFFLQREQDSSALRQAKKAAKKALRRSNKRTGSVDEGDGEGEKDKGKEKEREKEKENNDNDSRSLWEGIRDEKGKVRSWKNKITGSEVRAKKGEKPIDSKGSLLADDMGLGKTLSVISLIAATRSSSREYARTKIESIESSSTPDEPELDLKTGEFKTKVFGMPSIDEMIEANSAGKKRKRDEEQTKNLAARRARIAHRSRATLLVTPMSTISNWEDQMKEHWNGPVEIVGGASGVMPPKKIERKWKPPRAPGASSDDEDDDDENFDVLRVYIYHGPSRRSDPQFIADFDVVITSYNTLANEFSKQNGSCDTDATTTPGETADNSGEENGEYGMKMDVDQDIKAVEVAAALLDKKGAKKGRGRPKKDAAVGDQTSPLQAVDWFRIVLDEAHYIKTATTVASQAACALEADRRVALSGTPIQNKIEDVWALFKFLRISPVDGKECFTQYISTPCKTGEQIGVARLQLIMRCCTLRRTKESTHEDGSKILNLPPRSERQMWLTLREDERKIYDERASQAKNKIGELKANNETSKIYVNMLQEVLRLRQICNHVDLAMLGPVEEDYDGTIMDYEVAVQGIEQNGLNQPRGVAVVCSLKEGEGARCNGCSFDFGDWFPWIGLGGVEEEREKPTKKKLNYKLILTKCLHLYCQGCFKKEVYADYSKRMKTSVARACARCQTMIRLPNDIIEVIPPDSSELPETTVPEASKRAVRKKYVRPSGEKLNLSTKMQFLHDELLRFSKKNPNSPHYDPFALGEDDVEEMDAEGKPFVTKSVVFSQWTTMLDRIADMLEETNIRYARLDGSMSREDRSKAIDALKYNKHVEVLLVSTRAGGVGLNLTVASRCYLVDPYWNPSVESQAIDRIHRMGQTRPVVAIKLMIKDSIEEKLDKIQKKKADLAQLSLKNMSRKELMAQKSEELASLFS